MQVAVPQEIDSEETRCALTPAGAAALAKLGATVQIEAGTGAGCHFEDESFTKEGATLVKEREKLISEADLIVRVGKPAAEEIGLMKSGAIHVSFLDPFKEKSLVEKMAERGVSTISMEMIPRITRAQKMDALSSQASLSGYVATVLAVHHLGKIFPMMMTAAGTITPARVFVIGAGVAGLQAIATARRLGARVEAYDPRPGVQEEIESLGAKFVKIDVGETQKTQEGYAKPLTEEQLAIQRKAMQRHCSLADVVITAAQVFGRKAPLIVLSDMIAAMTPGSVVVDTAVENGGNVEGIQRNKIVEASGVKLIGLTNLPGQVPQHASQVYSSNIVNLIQEFWDQDKDKGEFDVNAEDEILQGCLITHKGAISNPRIKEHYEPNQNSQNS